MATLTRRISFYLKPAAVNSEREACNYLDSLPASERSRAQRAAFLAGLALIKHDPAFAYWLAEWPEKETMLISDYIRNVQVTSPTTVSDHCTSQMKKNIQAFFPE
ncbi:TPA: plasmid partitioning/stability family protein [Escherichia coli]|uniref:plasmid partitioning/stability family protein n=1 Tax=Escherichia coli TaxID=562 RepID=UPI00169C24C0|nr:peptide transporter [Escherichia coli]EEW0756635.1 peptide transporter [Escherichia coli]EFI2329883.1 peptide transporter [Escherichia coli]EFJ7243170.1 peptide transporter [Escherichia coli]EFL3987433.1 peptide transporter [Escherichia coli]